MFQKHYQNNHPLTNLLGTLSCHQYKVKTVKHNLLNPHMEVGGDQH
nr:MAG TPA: hypothetical protein [Bacteriophage sp.]